MDDLVGYEAMLLVFLSCTSAHDGGKCNDQQRYVGVLQRD